MQKIIDSIHIGLKPYQAFLAAGLNPTSLSDICNTGRRDLENGVDSEPARFVAKVTAAQMEFIAGRLRNILNQEPDNWNASKWLLEVFEPDTYTPRSNVALDASNFIGKDPAVLHKNQLQQLTTDELRTLLELRMKMRLTANGEVQTASNQPDTPTET